MSQTSDTFVLALDGVFLIAQEGALFGCFLILALLAVVFAVVSANRERQRRHLYQHADALEASLREMIPRCFAVEPCRRCHESALQFIDVSPNARSIQYQCQRDR